VHIVAELEPNASAEDDEELLGIPVRVLLGPGRSTRVELADKDLEVMERPRGQEHLPPEDPESERAQILMMTAHATVESALEAMKLGAMDFLEKPFEDDRLIGMIEAALRQAEPGVKSEAITLEITSRIATLSGRERQVMEGLIAGLSNKLTAREYDISPRTIEVYRANVMTKMQAASLSELVRLAALLRDDDGGGRQILELVDQIIVVDPHRRAQQGGST